MAEIRSEGDDKIVNRVHSLVLLFNKLKLRWPGEMQLNKAILVHCVESYFKDLERTKDFHEIKHADQHKRAAFLIKWIAKLKPIQLLQEENVTSSILLVNAVYAVNAGLEHFDITINDIKNFSPVFLNNFLYTLHYRNLDGESFASKMYLMERAIKKTSP